MPERRGTRFIVEVLFLAALATALVFAHLSAVEIVGVMAVGWLVVAALEWAAWRSEPHYGSGLPPKYYVPGVNLPPPQPLEQVDQGYPGASRDDAPTWIASAALRAEVLGEWPVAAPVTLDDEEEEEDDEPEFLPASAPDADPWTVAELPAEPVPARVEVRPVQPRGSIPAGTRLARHTLDPLADTAPRRRFGRRGQEVAAETVEVAARPYGPRPLPGVWNRA